MRSAAKRAWTHRPREEHVESFGPRVAHVLRELEHTALALSRTGGRAHRVGLVLEACLDWLGGRGGEVLAAHIAAELASWDAYACRRRRRVIRDRVAGVRVVDLAEVRKAVASLRGQPKGPAARRSP